MQTLDIECPSCGEMLELDAGFAGGVCRCSNCGTLMTVPSDAGKAESLTRPTSSVSIGSGGLSAMGVPDPGPRRTSSRGSKSSKGKGKTSKGRPISATVEAGEYRTASGKVIRVDETTRVPMAERKRKQIRMATTVVFFSIVALVVALAVVGIIAIMSGPGGAPGSGPGSRGAAVYDAAANPYTLTFGNAMGLPVTDATAVVIEASEYSAQWMAQVADMLAVGLSQPSGGKVALIGASGKQVEFAGGAMQGLPLKAAELRDWLTKLPNTGEADIANAISAALKVQPKTLILVVGYADTKDVEKWDALVKDKDDLKVHVVFIGNSSPELQGWMSERGGEVVVLSPGDIDTLKEIAAEGTASK